MADDARFERRLRQALAREVDALPMRVDAVTVRERLAPRRRLPSWVLPVVAPVAAAVVVAAVVLVAFPGPPPEELAPGGAPDETVAASAGGPSTSSAPTAPPEFHPAERTDAGVVSGDRILVLVGGTRRSGDLASVVSYNGLVWTELPSLPQPRSSSAAARLPDGTIVVAGGLRDGSPLDSTLILPPGGDGWVETSPMPYAQAHMGAAVVDGRLLVFGGSVEEHAADGLAFDPASETWTAISPMPAPLSRVAATSADGAALLFGGRDPSGAATPTALRYDPAADAWEALPPMPAPGDLLTATAVDGRIWVLGVPMVDRPDGRILIYDVAATTWEERPGGTTRSGRWHAAVHHRNGDILVVAGGQYFTVEHLSTRDAPPSPSP